MCLGACIPNALIPEVPAPVDVTDSPIQSPTVAPEPDAGRIFCVSDLHADHPANMEWCRGLRARGDYFRRDVLIVAGDVTSSHAILKETLEILVKTFATVFYTPGNHDLWVKGRLAGGVHVRPKPINSLERLEEVRSLCAQLGVLTRPAYACGAIICPISSWYHESWDTEPDIKGWKGIPPHNMVMSDYHACTWPPPLSNTNDSIAAHFDALNDADGAPLPKVIKALREAHPNAPLITCSHFVPHMELNPEKRFLFFPPLAKACGSSYLAKRIATLTPELHCFGHTVSCALSGRTRN